MSKKGHFQTFEVTAAYEKLFFPEIYSDDDNFTMDKAFAISNEQLEQIFNDINLEGKSFVTVGSSGDQALNAILKGSKDITLIDGNIFAQPFIEYKLAVIKTFDYQTFSDIFIKNDFFNWKVYSKISHLLSKNIQAFWDSLMIDVSENNYGYEFSAKTIKEKLLFVDHRDRYSTFYHNEEVYNKLQSLLNDPSLNISFITAQFQDFPKVLNNKYDFIYLSNIFDYFRKEHSKKFEQTLDKLYVSNLKDDGYMLVHYNFNGKLHNVPDKIVNYEIEPLEVSRLSSGELCQDIAWILKKQAHDKSIIKR